MPNPQSSREPMHIISLGAGVQSSTMALMAAAGEITPMPAAAIFSDTHAEPPAVYSWLNTLEKLFPFPVYRVSAGSLREDQLKLTTGKNGDRYVRNLVPAFVKNPLGGAEGMLLRKCTRDYKITPIRRKTRELWEAAGRPKMIQWIGISTDEASRMKPSDVSYIEHRWPLLEDENLMSRKQCIAWLESRGFPVPSKSACSFCPYRSDGEWVEMKRNDPETFEDAARMEDQWNEILGSETGENRMVGAVRLHRSLLPLRVAEFRGDPSARQQSMFQNECEGICGV